MAAVAAAAHQPAGQQRRQQRLGLARRRLRLVLGGVGMTAQVIDGQAIAAQVRAEVAGRAAALRGVKQYAEPAQKKNARRSYRFNIASRSFGDLTGPSTPTKSLPIPFLWVEKLMTQVGGVTSMPFVPSRCSPALRLSCSCGGWDAGRSGSSPPPLLPASPALSTFP